MQHIDTRNQLIDWLEDNAPTISTQRAVRDGNIELLGLFDPIPSSSNPGWIIQTTSLITGKTWNIVVSMQRQKPFYYSWLIKDIPWKSWRGADGYNSLIYGDDPNRYYDEMVAAR